MKRFVVDIHIHVSGGCLKGTFDVHTETAYLAKRKVIELFRDDVIADGDGIEVIEIKEC